MAFLNSIALVILIASCMSLINCRKVGDNIVEEVALPTSLVHRLSPLSSSAISRYTAFLEDGSLAKHAAKFCAASGIMCSDAGYNVRAADVQMSYTYYVASNRASSKVATHSQITDEEVREVRNKHVYFREKELVVGGQFLVSSLANAVPPRPFLPKAIAARLPVSSSSLPYLSQLLGIPHNSNLFRSMEETLQECETERMGEVKVCATSVEDMLQFAKESMQQQQQQETAGRSSRIQILSTDVASTSFPQSPTFEEVAVKVEEGKMSMICHDAMFPFTLYYCHQTPHSKVFAVSWTMPDKRVVRAIAMCHMNTTGLDATHPAFASLYIQPGHAEFCHWIKEHELIMSW